MPPAYSQTKALWAITRASYKAIFANPSAIIFSILFPIIFVMIFGAFGSGGAPTYKIALAKTSDTSNAFYKGLKANPYIRIVSYHDSASLNKDMVKGSLTAVVDIQQTKDSAGQTKIIVNTNSTSASGATLGSFKQLLELTSYRTQNAMMGNKGSLIAIPDTKMTDVRQYRQIDFVLPGQLGFSILFSTLFGIAFLLYGLREQLVLKRFYASPVNRINILLGIGMSRLFFQLVNVIVLILFGHFVFDFTLQHGAVTFIEILVMTIIMLFLLMGVGLIFSSIVKSDTSIPLLINLFGFPQMMLAGTFFPIDVFPKWLQAICKVLPLTQYNDAVRKISFEGLGIMDCWKEIGILGIWMFVVYVIAVKLLKWE